jgi:serine/threonine-protein kinase
VRRFHREAETAASLEHPHIVPIYDYGTEREMKYVVMRMLTGGSLAETLDRWIKDKKSPIALSDIALLLRQIAGALDYAHERGVIHRDVKPSNVMFDDYGNAFLVDFGLVKLVNATDSALTSDGIILGTPAFMAPEQWRDQPLTGAVDQYALAMLIYLLITGEIPFNPNANPYELMRLHCYAEPTPPNTKRHDVSEAMSKALLRAMAKDPGDRFARVMDFAEAFQAALAQPVSAVQSPGLSDPERTLHPGPPKRANPVAMIRVEQSRDHETIGKVMYLDTFPFQIGRLNRDLNFNGDRNVSRNHAQITCNERGEFFVEDQGSTLRTTVDELEIQPYQPVKLAHNSRICLGTTTLLTFSLEEDSGQR